MYNINKRSRLVKIIDLYKIDSSVDTLASNIIKTYGDDALKVATELFEGAKSRYEACKDLSVKVNRLVTGTSDLLISDRYSYVREELERTARKDVDHYRRVMYIVRGKTNDK